MVRPSRDLLTSFDYVLSLGHFQLQSSCLYFTAYVSQFRYEMKKMLKKLFLLSSRV